MSVKKTKKNKRGSRRSVPQAEFPYHAPADPFENESAASMRQKCLDAVAAEPELPGPMPDALWSVIQLGQKMHGEREWLTKVMRITVQQTKDCIKERIRKL